MKKFLLAALLMFAMPAFAGEAKTDAAEPVAESKVAEAPALAPAETPVSLQVTLTGAEAKGVGSATITAVPRGLIVRVEATGLAQGWHGLHFHATGDCGDHADHFKKSGSHLSKEGETHGYFTEDGPHAGDLPNIFAGADGVAKAEFMTATLDFDTLQDKDGSAIMIHAGPDDYRTAPSGDSGERLACGVIGPAEGE